ncbi:MAG TPA: sigma 54-interacting transcriptional regulator [Candidatus Ozemobacteraceae bacterium]|nr:sigma 54-interacting transcriptional regulator [Candidatus Ozemobacteraceae bacterium]
MKSCNTEEFFREVALRIHSSLEVDEAIKATFNYMCDFIPMDMMGMYLVEDVDDGGVKVFSVSRYGQRLLNEPDDIREPILWLNSKEVSELEAFEKSQKKSITIDNFGNFPAPMLKIFANIERYSMLKMEIDSGGYRGCSLVIAKEGKNVYRQHHADLLLSVMKPFSIAMSNAIRYRELLQLKEGLIDENQAMKTELERAGGDLIVGADFGLRRVMEMVKTVSRTSSPVLLLGETGTGKEVIAKKIHQTSPRRDGPFVRVQCGAMPESLLDSELFGHERGAFTGAVAVNKGRFERANNGTIFLDEIGELSPEAQVKLLRVLQEKEYERVGGQHTLKIDVRVIAATHRNLLEMVHAGKFREDLWFRLNVFPIELPPLRQRKEDIFSLVQYFMVRKARELNLPVNQSLAPGTLERLLQYDWPGNVRELQNVVERGLIVCNGQPIEIPASYFLGRAAVARSSESRMDTLENVVRAHLSRVLETTRGRIEGPGGAAEILALNPSTLRGKLRKYRIPFGHRM